MKTMTTTVLALVFTLAGGLAVTVAAPPEAEAQTMRRGKKTTTTKKTTTRRTTRTTTRRSSRSHSHRTRTHGSHGTHHRRNGIYVQFRFGHRYYYPHRTHYYRHHSHHSVYHRSYVYPRQTDVVVVEPEPGFVMPELDCPVRTDEVRVGMSQWCETARGNKHGPFRRWYDDGRIATEGEYEYDLKEGVWVEWHPNGAIRQEGAYDDGTQVGTWITWGSDGEELVVVDHDENK